MCTCVYMNTHPHTLAHMMQGDNGSVGADFHETVLKVPRVTEASSCKVVLIVVLED